MKRTDIPATWDERTTLLTMLDYTRATVHAKCGGISEEDARRALLPTSPLMTVAGIVNHLRWAEYTWFQVVFLGEEDQGPWTDEDPDREFRIAVEEPLGELLVKYGARCARYRELVSQHSLDEQAKRTVKENRPNLRWILHHLVEETARHNGHLDILREQLDGTKGD